MIFWIWLFSPDGSGILLWNVMEQKIKQTAGIASKTQKA